MSDRFKTVYSKGNNFVIDNSNNRIGINKSSPEEALDVLGNIKATDIILDGAIKNKNDTIYKLKLINALETHKFSTTTGNDKNDFFGTSVAFSGNYAIIGGYNNIDTYKGFAYVYEYNDSTWTQKQTLTISDAGVRDMLGSSVAINGNYAFIGAEGHYNDSRKGCVYIFENKGLVWEQIQKLEASDGASEKYFGSAIATNGNYLLIGSKGGNDNGAAYMFEFNGNTWTEKHKLLATTGILNGRLGWSVAMNDNYAVIGSPYGGENNTGTVYIFNRDENGNWGTSVDGQTYRNETIEITNKKGVSTDNSWDYFGWDVSISDNNYIIISASGYDNSNFQNSGAVYIYKLDGETWLFQQAIEPSQKIREDYFGHSVLINDKLAIIGSRGHDNTGSVHIFERNGNTWIEKQKITASDAVNNDRFGYDLALNDNHLIVSARGENVRGSAYVYKIYDSEINTYDLIVNNNVGIGINDPSEKLEIKGGIKIENALQDSAGTIRYTSTNGFEGYHENQWSSLAGGGSNDSGGSGNGVSLVPTTAQTSDLSANRPFPNNHTGTGKEGDIIYDVSKNKFYEASNSKEDGQTGGEVKFRELGYSFFSEHMEGQPPAPSFFFFSITPSSIKINWTNPIQYHSGVSNSNDPHNNTNNGEFSSTVNSNSNIYFPVVNRIMIQIYNKETQSYETWGDKRSPVTSSTATSGGVDGLKNGYVLCSKNYPIPPMGSSVSPYFGTRNAIGRNVKVYELKDFADSIILYKKDNTPENSTIQPTIQNNKLASSIKEESNEKELNTSTSGYEIKLWLENQYDSGNMTINDFNVVTLTQDNDGNNINFQTVDPPTNPISVETKVAFNDLGKVSDGKTYIELAVKDPKRTSQTTTGDFNNINLTRIKIQYANVEDTTTISESSWNNISKIYWNNTNNYSSNSSLFQSKLLSSSNFSNGIHVIDRVNDHSSIDDSDTTTIRYYYIKIDNEFLSTITNYNVNSKFIFRVSYKNASNDNFGLFQQSNVISINRPNKPTISQVKMTSYNTFTITLAGFNDREDIIGDTTSISNNNMGVFLRNINFNVAYQYSGQSSQSNITTFTTIYGGESSQTNSTSTPVYVNTTSFGSSTYTYTLPAGFYPNGSTNTNPITYYFSASVQNNLISDYSEVSDQQFIQITKPNSSMTITLAPQTSGSNYNNKILATFTAPSNGNRGIESTQANPGFPKLQKYTFQSTNLKNVDIDPAVEHTNTINASSRNADPSTQRMLTFYDSLKGTTGSVTKNLDLAVREYNEYINDHTEVTTNMSATATKPELVTISNHTNLAISNTITKNTVKLNWAHPTNRGLSIGGNNIRNTILTYRINIERAATTNKYIDNNSNHSDTTYETTTTQSDNSNDKTGTVDATNTKTLTSSNDGSLLWPNSTYNYTVRATNSLGYQSDVQTTVGTFTTGVPVLPSGFEYFTSSKLNNLRNTYDLKNNNYYQNLGVLVSAGVSSSTTYSGTAVQITNYNNLSNITSNTVTHVLNKKHLQDFNNTLSNSLVQSWSSSVPTTANQAGFKIVNAANSDAVLYTIGMSTNHTTETEDDTVFQVLRTNRKDIYSETYDDRNRGYWLKETIQYKINLATESDLLDYLYKPLKLELKSYYNTNGSDTNISSTQTGETVILQNSYSSNGGNVYLDVLNSNPSIVKNSTNNMITYTPSNQINGIPNLARGGTIVLKYKLSNYSQYYLLRSTVNVAEHYFSYAASSANSVISWTSKSGGTRNSNHWIVDKTVSYSSIPSTNTAYSGITIKITARNTKGTSDLIIGSSHSVVYNFIYDKPSSDVFTSIESSLQNIPSNFDPTYGSTSAQSSFTNSSYSAKGGTLNNKQLSLWNGYFYGSQGWQNATSITTSNCTNYGMSITLPVFSTGSDYKWVIFKYQGSGNSTSAYTYYTVIVKFSDSDFDYDNNIVDEDIVVYFYNRGQTTQGNDGNNYYWLNISGKSDYGKADASTAAINTYSGTVGISTQNANSSIFESNSYSKLGTSGSRIIGGWLNSSSIPANTTANFYLAVGIKNTTTSGNNDVKIKKPEITLAQESVVRQILT